MDIYSVGERKLDTVNTISRKLNSFDFSQFSIGFNAPFLTKDNYNKDSTRISNIHFLFSGGYTALGLNFSGISEHTLTKTFMGVKGFYNNGKKSIFFIELTPFVTEDYGHSYTTSYRLASSIIYNYTANERFSFRLGITRSFIWGNRFHLPYIGMRAGRLDRINLSIQFPRSISLNFPIGKYVRTSIYTKSQGGLYSFANVDSIPVGDFSDNSKLYFGRTEFLTGWRIDVMPSKYFNAYLSSGFTTQNYISFTASSKSKSNTTPYTNYYGQSIKGSIFLNIGLVVRFGRTKSIYHNFQMYDAIDMNNSDIGDSNIITGNGNIPVPEKKIKVNNPSEILDLIEVQDLY